MLEKFKGPHFTDTEKPYEATRGLIEERRQTGQPRRRKRPNGLCDRTTTTTSSSGSSLALHLIRATSAIWVLLAAENLGFRRTATVDALKIINFRVPAYVPITLPAQHQLSPSLLSAGAKAAPIDHPYHPLDLAKPILMDCDYQYDPEEDARLTVKWFKNKEPEPFYQWLPELDARYFADWIRPLVELDFVSDPHDPLKRYRSLLFKRLSMNLTGQYTCLVTSLASQDQRQSSLIVFQPPRSFTFEHRIFPPPSLVAPGRQQPPMALSGASQLVPPANSQQAANNVSSTRQQPTQFKNLASGQQQLQQPKRAGTIRPPNNNATVQVAAQASSIPQNPLATSQANVHNQSTPAATKIVYTHDGRPIAKRPSDKTKRQIPSWMLDKKAAPLFPANPLQTPANPLILGPQPTRAKPRYAIQLHHFLCRATHLTPRPVMVLMVKRDPDSIAQYLHESSSVSIRPFQVNHFDYFESVSANGQQLAPSGVRNETSSSNSLLVTLYDITVSATIALNVTLPPASPTGPNVEPAEHSRHEPKQSSWPTAGGLGLAEQQQQQATSDSLITTGINTILHFHPNQRMSFECHLEITATEFEQRKRIFITPDEVYRFAEAEEQKQLERITSSKQRTQLGRSQQTSETSGTGSGSGSFNFIQLGSSSARSDHHRLGSERWVMVATFSLVALASSLYFYHWLF